MEHFFQYIKKELRVYMFDYLILFTGGIFFLIAISIFKGEHIIQFVVLLTFSSFYIMWGIYHHIIEGDLHIRTVLEYILIGFSLLFLLKIILLP